ncbi:MAG: hypothetical protein GY795_14990 [Desulfobacterales bacterium]|nr:hypothetical protein [Desulfobacterales bacterium]
MRKAEVFLHGEKAGGICLIAFFEGISMLHVIMDYEESAMESAEGIPGKDY